MNIGAQIEFTSLKVVYLSNVIRQKKKRILIQIAVKQIFAITALCHSQVEIFFKNLISQNKANIQTIIIFYSFRFINWQKAISLILLLLLLLLSLLYYYTLYPSYSSHTLQDSFFIYLFLTDIRGSTVLLFFLGNVIQTFFKIRPIA